MDGRTGTVSRFHIIRAPSPISAYCDSSRFNAIEFYMQIADMLDKEGL